jgi:hypothetical protein
MAVESSLSWAEVVSGRSCIFRPHIVPDITVSRNFFNDTNFSKHMIHILRALSRLVEGVTGSPNWQE